MDINRFEGQGTLITYEGDEIPIEIFRLNNEINIIIDRYLLKKKSNTNFISNYNFVIVGQLGSNGKIRTFAWKSGIDGYKLKVHPKNELIQLVGILTDFLLIDHIKPVITGQTQYVKAGKNLVYELNFENEARLSRIVRHDEPGYGLRSKLILEFEKIIPLSKLPYRDCCNNYEVFLDYYDSHIASFIDIMNENEIAPMPKGVKLMEGYASDIKSNCFLGRCYDTYNCGASGCLDHNRPLSAGVPLGINRYVDFRDMATVPEPHIAHIKVTPPSVTKVVKPQPPTVTKVINFQKPHVHETVRIPKQQIKQYVDVEPVVKSYIHQPMPKITRTVHQRKPIVYQYVKPTPPKVSHIYHAPKYNLTHIQKPTRYGPYGAYGTYGTYKTKFINNDINTFPVLVSEYVPEYVPETEPKIYEGRTKRLKRIKKNTPNLEAFSTKNIVDKINFNVIMQQGLALIIVITTVFILYKN
jgi:hypothetical protein